MSETDRHPHGHGQTFYRDHALFLKGAFGPSPNIFSVCTSRPQCPRCAPGQPFSLAPVDQDADGELLTEGVLWQSVGRPADVTAAGRLAGGTWMAAFHVKLIGTLLPGAVPLHLSVTLTDPPSPGVTRDVDMVRALQLDEWRHLVIGTVDVPRGGARFQARLSAAADGAPWYAWLLIDCLVLTPAEAGAQFEPEEPLEGVGSPEPVPSAAVRSFEAVVQGLGALGLGESVLSADSRSVSDVTMDTSFAQASAEGMRRVASASEADPTPTLPHPNPLSRDASLPLPAVERTFSSASGHTATAVSVRTFSSPLTPDPSLPHPVAERTFSSVTNRTATAGLADRDLDLDFSDDFGRVETFSHVISGL